MRARSFKLNPDDEDQRPRDLTLATSLSSTQDEAKPPCDCETAYSFGRVIRHHDHPLRFFIAAVVAYTVVCNAVIPEPIPSKSRLGSADGEKSNFCSGRYPLLVRIQISDGDTPYVAVLRLLFILPQRWRRVRTQDVGISICLRVEIPQGPIPPMPVPLKPFNPPPHSDAHWPCHDNRNPGSFHPRYVHSSSAALVHSLQFFCRATPQTKTVEPSRLLPASLYPFRLRRGR